MPVRQALPAPASYIPQAVVTQICGTVFSKVVMTAVDRLLLPEPKLGDLRDDMIAVINESEPRVAAVRAKRAAARQPPPQEPEMADDPEDPGVEHYIEASLDALAQAKGATHCKVCQQEIDAAARDVSRRLAVIQNTDRVYKTMKGLEAQGELPRGATWNTLKETERERVRRVARGYG